MKRVLGAAMIMLLAACGTPTADDTAGDAGGPGDLIGVTGHWTIDVVDPDGSVVETHEFRNEILATGWEALGYQLTGDLGLPDWAVVPTFTEGFTCNQAPIVASPYDCILPGEASYDASDQSVVLAASVTPDRAETVTVVRSLLEGPVFSYHLLDEPVTLAAGQGIQIEIRFRLGAPEDLLAPAQP